MSEHSNNILTLPVVDMVDERQAILLDIFRFITAMQLRRNIQQIYIYGLHNTQHLVNHTGAIIALNHQSYWNTPLFLYLSELLGKRAFSFMPKEYLSNRAYLRWCGIIPLATNTPSIAQTQLRNAFKLATEPTQLWAYPQEQHHSVHFRPMQFNHNIGLLASSTAYPIVPTTIQFLFHDDKRPHAYIHFGTPLSSKASMIDFTHAVSLGLDAIQAFYKNPSSNEFQALFKRNDKRPSWFRQALSMFASWSLRDHDAP